LYLHKHYTLYDVTLASNCQQTNKQKTAVITLTYFSLTTFNLSLFNCYFSFGNWRFSFVIWANGNTKKYI